MLVTNVSKGIKNHQPANDTKRHDEITEKKSGKKENFVIVNGCQKIYNTKKLDEIVPNVFHQFKCIKCGKK